MKVAIYTRVSTEEQTELNQVAVLEKWAADRKWEVAGIYGETGSAWQHSDQKELRRLIEDCRHGLAQTVIVNDLSRLSRRGPYATLKLVRDLAQIGVRVMSYRDSWIEQFTEPSLRDAFIAFMGFLNEDESRRISERTKAGMARARAQGKHIGRPKKERVKLSPEDKKAHKRLESLQTRVAYLQRQIKELGPGKGVSE